MGKKDITLNEFLGDPHIFADLLNGCFFRGRQEIRPEELLPMDSVQGTRSLISILRMVSRISRRFWMICCMNLSSKTAL